MRSKKGEIMRSKKQCQECGEVLYTFDTAEIPPQTYYQCENPNCTNYCIKFQVFRIEISERNIDRIKDKCKVFGEKMITKDFIEVFVNSVVDQYLRDP